MIKVFQEIYGNFKKSHYFSKCFFRYSHVNTDDTVRRIKEILSQYSISQRLFGEAVLGLSQVGLKLVLKHQVFPGGISRE